MGQPAREPVLVPPAAGWLLVAVGFVDQCKKGCYWWFVGADKSKEKIYMCQPANLRTGFRSSNSWLLLVVAVEFVDRCKKGESFSLRKAN